MRSAPDAVETVDLVGNQSLIDAAQGGDVKQFNPTIGSMDLGPQQLPAPQGAFVDAAGHINLRLPLFQTIVADVLGVGRSQVRASTHQNPNPYQGF